MANASPAQKPTNLDVADGPRLSTVDRVVDRIGKLIIERGLRFGDPLPTERELGDLYATSRNTVREALQVLRAYGIVESRPKVGAVLSDGRSAAIQKLFSFHSVVSRESFLDVQGFRRIVETGVADQIIQHCSEKDFDLLDDRNARFLTGATVQERAQRDYEFHDAIVELSGNRATLAAYRMLRPVIEEIMLVGKDDDAAMQLGFAAHAELVAALRARDKAAFGYLLGRHLKFGLQFVKPTPGTGSGASG